MGDMGEIWNDVRNYGKNLKRVFGVDCPKCTEEVPKSNPSKLLPQQRCKRDGYVDQRPMLTEKEKDYAQRSRNCKECEHMKDDGEDWWCCCSGVFKHDTPQLLTPYAVPKWCPLNKEEE